jgi:D-aminoacyl-tRNA deacylase
VDSTVRAMRAVVQRVDSAAVKVDGEQIAAIGRGLLVLLAVGVGDTEADADWIVRKLRALRAFPGPSGPMDRSIGDVGGELLCVSQFTLYGDVRRGNRPSFTEAAPPEAAEPLYERVRSGLGAAGGRFGAHMEVSLVNDGPVTLTIESPTDL